MSLQIQNDLILFINLYFFLSFNILHIFYVLLWIKYGFMIFPNDYILLLLMFYTTPQFYLELRL